MSDEWNVYPCQMGESPAFISYDHGIREELDRLPETLVKVRVAFAEPNEAGLPTNAEFEALSNLEDLLTEAFAEKGGVIFGRVSVDGYRYFHAYVEADDDVLQALGVQVAESTGYRLGFIRESDPERRSYWEDVFPTLLDWRVIQDLKVISSLEEHGDPLEVPRRVDHWLYFPDTSSRESFEVWAADAGFQVEGRSTLEDGDLRYSLQIHHEVVPRHPEISSHTIGLIEAAHEHGGAYDGWETAVLRA